MTSAGRPRLSVLMITRNEERMLGTVLESVRWADEIVIIDSGSSDRTEEIARGYTEHFHRSTYEGHGRQRQKSLDASRGEWLLYLDADEVVTPRLADSIRAAVASPTKHAGFRMELHTYFMGQWFGTKGWRKEWKTRLFRRGAGEFEAKPIHEGAIVRGSIGTLEGVLLHYPYRDLEHLVDKINRYSTAMEASGRTGGAGSAGVAVARGAARFFRDYLLGGDFLYGGAGLVRSATSGCYAFLKYAKAWERTIPPTTIAPPPADLSEPMR